MDEKKSTVSKMKGGAVKRILREFSRDPNEDKLAYLEELQGDDLGLPGVREVHLPCVEQDGLGGVARYLLWAWLLQDISNRVP